MDTSSTANPGGWSAFSEAFGSNAMTGVHSMFGDHLDFKVEFSSVTVRAVNDAETFKVASKGRRSAPIAHVRLIHGYQINQFAGLCACAY